MSDRTNNPEFLDPEFEPGEFDRVERQLRRSLTSEADRITPHDRLGTILHEAHEAGPVAGSGAGARRWLRPLAAAAAVALVAAGAWAATHGGKDELLPTPPQSSGPVATSRTTGSTPSPTGQVTSPPTSGGSATSVPPAPSTASVSLPVYFLGPVGDDKPTYKLFRDFIKGEVPTGATAEEKAKAALVLAINAQPYTNTDGYLQPWSGQTIGAVTVTPRLITVDLANAGNPAAVVGEENKRLAIQELVWTAQAAVQQGNVPVKFTVHGKAAKLFGTISTTQTFTRPAPDRLYEDLAPIWITAPTRDQVLPAGKPVTVKGLAIVFEANVSWELRRGTTQLKTGHATASIGAPMQGEYSFSLGVLAPGDYSIRVFELSMEGNDKVVGEKTVSFSVK